MRNFFYIITIMFIGIQMSGQSSVGFHLGVGRSHEVGPLNTVISRDYFSMIPGFDYQYQLNERWAFCASIGILNLSEKSQQTIRWGSEQNGNGDFIPDPSLPHQSKIRYFAFYAGLQTGAKYYFAKWRRMKFYGQMDEAINLLFGNRSTQILSLDDGSIYTQKTEPINQKQKAVLFGTNIGVGAEFPLTDNFNIFLLPELKALLGSINFNKDALTFMPGIQLGMSYKL